VFTLWGSVCHHVEWGSATSSDLRSAKAAKRRRIPLVGHEPELGELAAHLIGASSAIPFKKGGVCRMDIESLTSSRGAGTLVWFAGPKMLRQLGT
jgi:phosphohistidine phosphatase SixA